MDCGELRLRTSATAEKLLMAPPPASRALSLPQALPPFNSPLPYTEPIRNSLDRLIKLVYYPTFTHLAIGTTRPFLLGF